MKINSIIILAIVILAVLAAAVLFFPSYRYSVDVGGVRLQSNTHAPVEYVHELSQKGVFIISPAMPEEGNIRAYMANAMNLFVVVLEGNGRNTVQLVRVVDSGGKLLYCQSNLGDLKKSEKLSTEQCLKFIEDSNTSVKVFINLPKEGNVPSVTIEDNKLILDSSTYSQVGPESLILLKAMFPNAETILKNVNAAAGSLGATK